jgi:hypothetical protein
VLDRVAVAEDGDRQVDHLGHRLYFAVAANGNFHGDIAVLAQDVIGRQCNAADAPFIGGEIGRYRHHAQAKHDQSALHENPRSIAKMNSQLFRG